jgi:hypothetical protein
LFFGDHWIHSSSVTWFSRFGRSACKVSL